LKNDLENIENIEYRIQHCRYLSKLGDYMRILNRIPSLLEKIGKAKITVEQVMT
jgi:hypothetical protein